MRRGAMLADFGGIALTTQLPQGATLAAVNGIMSVICGGRQTPVALLYGDRDFDAFTERLGLIPALAL